MHDTAGHVLLTWWCPIIFVLYIYICVCVCVCVCIYKYIDNVILPTCIYLKVIDILW